MEEKADTLKEFDKIITGLSRLAQLGPNYKDYDKSEKKYQGFRTRAIKLLINIDSPDKQLNDGLDYFRTVDLTLNSYNALQILRRLRSDYESDVFTLRPELPQQLPAVTVTEKPRWLDEPKAIIIAAIIGAVIGGLFVLLAASIQQSGTTSAHTNYTLTPSTSATLTATLTATDFIRTPLATSSNN